MKWFSSDLHIGHFNAIKENHRPFSNLEEMHETLIANINALVKPDDELYLLGDVCWKASYLPLFDLIDCPTIHLLLGNHDHEKVMKCSRWTTVRDLYRLKHDDYRLILCHYPIESWHGRERGSIHLHGHTHANMSHAVQKFPLRYDVGVDSWNMRPVSIYTIIERAKNETLVTE